jgi:hypothetical protein
VFGDRPRATGEQFAVTGSVQWIGVDLPGDHCEHGVGGGERGIHSAQMRQSVRVGCLVACAPVQRCCHSAIRGLIDLGAGKQTQTQSAEDTNSWYHANRG